MKVDKIVILGGGSAGWMSAATLVRAFPEKDISVIESPSVPSVGVGESTIGQLRAWTRYIGLDEYSFIPYTDASLKMSIKFTDFYDKDDGGFHYPFGRPYQEDENDPVLRAWYAMREYMPELPRTSLVDMLFPASKLWEKNKFSENANGEFGRFDVTNDVSYHFDATKFAEWLKEEYCLPRGVKWIPKHMKEAVGNKDDGVLYLLMDDGEKIYADLFVDATGFRSLLLGGVLEEPFISYDHILPNNKAWATQIPYKDKYAEIEPYTNCTAIENGWVWNIPLWSRIGTGYVYSDQYVTDEEALEEFKRHLQSDKMIVPRSKEEVDSYTYRNIQMRIGTHERTFVKNVVAIGLSAGFIEPLESNGLLSVHEFLMKLIRIMRRKEVTEFDRRMHNVEARDLYDTFAKFVAQHYAMSVRSDTPYWQANMDRQYREERDVPYSDRPHHRTDNFFYGHKKFYEMWYDAPNFADGFYYISAGMDYRPMFGSTIVEFERADPELKKKVFRAYVKWRKREQEWEEAAEKSPHLLDYLAEKYYNQ